MQKKKLGIDFDDVLIDFVGHLTYFHNTTYGTSHSKETTTTWNLHEVWSISEEDAIKRTNDFLLSEDHKNIIPIEGAQETLTRLHEKFELIIITARDKNLSEKAFHLIEKHFGSIFSEVHFLYDNGEKKNSKGALAKNLGIDFFIDDSVTNVISTKEAGITTFLFDTPWNRDFNDPAIKRVNSWKEIERLLFD